MYPGPPDLFILFSLTFCGGKAGAVTWQDQGPAPIHKNLTMQANYNAEVGRGGYLPQVVSAGLRYEF
jgi:hypothetical protein